jgi:hypothetical protein
MCALMLTALLFGATSDATELMINQAVAIADALAHDKLDDVATNAAGIDLEATSLGKPAAKISSAAKEILKASKIGDVRTAAGKMNEALVAYLDAQKRAPGPSLKVAVCPMVNKPWIQKDGPIRNPYYGSEMLSCGSFKK